MMRALSGYKLISLAALVLVALVVLPVAAVRSQQRRQSRRVTHPVRSQPVTQPAPTPVPQGTDPTLVSTAEEQPPTATQRTHPKPQPSPNPDAENTRKLDRLSADVSRLTEKLDAMEKERQVDLLQERLTRAEQRGETLRAQLSQTLEKQADLQARADQIEYDLRPESIQLRAATIGALNADAVRTQIQQQLENEKKRVRTQLDVLDATRQHLETSIATADAEAERLRTRLNQLIESGDTGPTNSSAGAGPNANTNATVAPSPTPSPSPPAP